MDRLWVLAMRSCASPLSRPVKHSRRRLRRSSGRRRLLRDTEEFGKLPIPSPVNSSDDGEPS